MHEVIAWVWKAVRHGNAIEQYAWALSVLIRTLLPEGMAYEHAILETSCLLLCVLVACTLVVLHQALQRRKPQRWACCVARVLSFGWFRITQDLDTSLVVLLRSVCSGLGPPEGGLVYGLFSNEALYIGKSSVSRTHCLGLAARLTGQIRFLYALGFKDANKPQYRLLRRKLWGVRFFPLAFFPTISQTMAAEALAISMELPMGKARDAAEERRGAKRRTPRFVGLAPAAEAAVGEYLGLFCCQGNCQAGPRSNQFSFQ